MERVPKHHKPGSQPQSPVASPPGSPELQRMPRPASPHQDHHHVSPPAKHVTHVPQPKRDRPGVDSNSAFDSPPPSPGLLKRAKPDDFEGLDDLLGANDLEILGHDAESRAAFEKAEAKAAFEKVEAKALEAARRKEEYRAEKAQYEAKVDDFLIKLTKLGWKGDPEKLKNDIINDGGLRIENNDLISLPPEIGNLTGLTQLVITGSALRELPAEIGRLGNLENLYLGKTQLESFPSEIGNLAQLKYFDLIDNYYLKTLPPQIGQLSSLKSLYIVSWLPANQDWPPNSTYFVLPPEISGLYNLRTLVVNRLETVPPEIGSLSNLIRLDLLAGNLSNLPELGNLTSLAHLTIRGDSVISVPSEIGLLTNLLELDLSGTGLTTLPASITALQNLRTLDLEDTPLAAEGDETTLGRLELVAHFGDRVILPFDDAIEAMPPATTREEVYAALDAKPIRVSREQLKNAQMREIPGEVIQDGAEFMHAFGKVVRLMNFTDDTSPGYLSYELMAGDYASDARADQGASNADKIRQYLLPRLNGYFKELYGLPREPNEPKGWQMHEKSKPALKKALSYILNRLIELKDPDQRASLFKQLVDGMLHCPTGQKEGVETVVNALLEGKTERGNQNLTLLVKDTIAAKKNAFFKTAVLTKALDGQNVHVISEYQGRLKEELGLNNPLEFEEELGIQYTDPFSDNENNVLKVFYDLVTPQRVVDWIMEKTPSKADLERAKRLTALEDEQRRQPTIERNQEIEALIPQVRAIKQFKPIDAAAIGAFFRDEMESEDGWKAYFTSDPLDVDAPPAALTRKGSMKILQRLGYITSNN